MIKIEDYAIKIVDSISYVRNLEILPSTNSLMYLQTIRRWQ